MVTAKEARETALLAKQQLAMEEQEKEDNRQIEIINEVEDRVEQEIVDTNKLISAAILNGQMSVTVPTSDNDVQRVLIGRLAVHYRKDGYRATWKAESVDMGDSIDQLILTISW